MTENPSGDITVSFVISVRDDEPRLESLGHELSAVAMELCARYEVVFVDDGSQDRTPATLRRLAEEDERVKVVELSRSFGRAAALAAGCDHARGRAAITLDADGPIEAIGPLIAQWREGFEIVDTVPKDGAKPPARQGKADRLISRVTRLLTGEAPVDETHFRLMDRKVLDALKQAPAHARLSGSFLEWAGFRRTAIVCETHRDTEDAEPKAAAGAEEPGVSLSAVLSLAPRPLRVTAAVGGVLAALAVLYGVVAAVLWPLGAAPGAGSNLLMLLLGLFGLQFLFLGLLGTYVGRRLAETRDRPIYVVRRTIGMEGEEAEENADQPQHDQFPPVKVFT